MKKIIGFILCFLLVLPLAAPVQAAETLYNVNITIEAPRIGESPCFFVETVKNDKGSAGVASVVSVSWYQYNPGKNMGTSDKFQADKIYEVTVRLKPDTGWIFAKNTLDEFYMTATVNGHSANVMPVTGNGDQVDVIYRFDAVGGLLTTASVNEIDAPVTGNTPDYNGVLGSQEYAFLNRNDTTFKNGITWYDRTDYKYVPTNHKFIAGHQYSVEIHLVPASGKSFALDATGCVNNTDIGVVAGGSDEIALLLDFPVCVQSGEMLTTVSVSDIEKPAVDQNPDYTGVLGSNKYKFKNENSTYFKNGIVWYDLTASRYIKTTEKFQDGHEYCLEIVLVPAAGYYFSDDVLAKVNGMEIYASGGGQEITITYTIGKCQAHTCKLTEVKEIPATCAKEGKKAYFYCAECEKNFEDEKGTKEIKDIDTWGVLTAEHKWADEWNYSNKKGHAHGCLNEGCKEHDELQEHDLQDGKCSVCGYGKEQEADEAQETKETSGKRRSLSNEGSDGPNMTLIIIVVVVAALAAGAAISVVVMKKRGEGK